MQYAPAKDKPQSKWVLWEPTYRQKIPERLLALTGERQCFMYQYKWLTSTSKMSPITNLQKKVLFINISTPLKVMFGDFGKSYVYFLYKLCLTLCREQDPVVPNSPMLGAQHLFHSQLRWYLLLVFCFVVVVLFLSPSVSVLVIGPPGTMQPYQSF